MHRIVEKCLQAPLATVSIPAPFIEGPFMSYAIFKSGGKQYRVSQGDVVDVDKLAHEEGAHAVFSDVLLVSEEGAVKIGTEAQGATVEAEVISQFKGNKVLAYQYRRRKGYHRTVGHRRHLTKLKITGIKA